MEDFFDPALSEPQNEQQTPTPVARRRWRRHAGWTAAAMVVLILGALYLVKDHIRTLSSLRRIPGTNVYVMDYYVDYNIDEIRAHGMDVKNVEDGLIDVYFPIAIASIAKDVKGIYLHEKIETTLLQAQQCSTVALRAPHGKMFFGRNLDWRHDACLVLRVHKNGVPTSVSVIDLHYLNLDRDDLEKTSLLQRLALLFAPYYMQDGMNQHGVAVADMSVDGVTTPHDNTHPNILHSTAMRLILDYATNTDEAIELLRQYNIYFVATTCHLMIADASGKSAVVEFIDGKIKVTRTNENWQVCTNHQIFGTTEEASDKTCSRYRLASEELSAIGSTVGADDVMQIMKSVANDKYTMWSSVYDLTTGEFQVAYRRQYDKPYVNSLTGAD